jgi:hypothetical protein
MMSWRLGRSEPLVGCLDKLRKRWLAPFSERCQPPFSVFGGSGALSDWQVEFPLFYPAKNPDSHGFPNPRLG